MLMVLFLGLWFLVSIQPMMMIVVLILITLMYSFWVYQIMGSFWFGYILMLVMLSGVLVVFTYMVSLIPNEHFEMYNLIFVMVFVLFFFKMKYSVLGTDLSYISLNMWFSYIGGFNLFLVGFLLSLMILVLWLSSLSQGSIRGVYMYAWLKG